MTSFGRADRTLAWPSAALPSIEIPDLTPWQGLCHVRSNTHMCSERIDLLRRYVFLNVSACGETTTTARLSASREPHHRGQGFQLLGMAADGVEEEVVGAHGHQRFQPLPHLLRRAVDS